MNVLSLFDGISCGMIALNRAGIVVDKYYASEIDKSAIKISDSNYPNIIRIGDVRSVDGGLYKNIDLLIGGSPCQSFSFAGKRIGMATQENIEITTLEQYLGLKNNAFEFLGFSYLFWEYVRILKESCPRYFLLENVKMNKKWENIITTALGVEPILINSSLVSAQNRKRLYWTNIPVKNMPKDKGLFLKDIVVDRKDKEGYNCTQRVLNKIEGTLAKEKAVKNTRTLNQKSKCLMCGQNISNTGATNIFYEDTKDYFIPTPVECERLQTVPDNYTDGISNTQRYKCIGNGWTIDVIAHIFSGLKGEVV